MSQQIIQKFYTNLTGDDNMEEEAKAYQDNNSVVYFYKGNVREL
jgi:hypothetical protein